MGSHLLLALLERTPWKILAVDLDFHRLQNLRSQKDSRVEFLLADIAEPQIIQMVSQCEIVVNLAAICTPSRYMSEALAVIESNFSHPAALADACAKTGSWLVYFSTSEVYGKTTLATEVLDEDASDFIQGSVKASRWSYAVAKQLSERYIAAIPNLKYSVVRPFNFIGPWMDFMPGVDGDGIPRVLANFSSALVQNEPMVLVNGGEARRSFTSIHDVVDFTFCLFENREKAYGEAFNVGNAKNELSIRELAVSMRRIYARILSVPEEKLSPFKELSGEAYYGEGYEDSLRRIPSVKKSKCLLGFEAKIPLEEALEESLRWFHAHYTSECKRS